MEIMTLQAKDVAIRSARKLTDEYGQDLPQAVEEELDRIRKKNSDRSPDESIEVVAIVLGVAQLVVAIAQLAVDLSNLFKQRSEPLPLPEEMVILVRQKIPKDTIKAAQRAKKEDLIKRITIIVVEDILNDENA
jgi:hypothetical protein